MSEFLFQDRGPQNIQICVLGLLSEKGGKVVYLGFCIYVRKTSCKESVIFCGWIVL